MNALKALLLLMADPDGANAYVCVGECIDTHI